jgi:hypothetical protein
MPDAARAGHIGAQLPAELAGSEGWSRRGVMDLSTAVPWDIGRLTLDSGVSYIGPML